MQHNLNEQQLETIYNWVDQIPLSRPKRNMARDFSDAVAQIIAHYNPKIVQLHNYITTGALSQKLINWKTLNQKVLKKLKIILTKEDIENLSNCVQNQAQKLLYLLKKNLIEEGAAHTVMTNTSKLSGLLKGIGQKKKQERVYTFKKASKIKQVSELLQNKDKCINLLKQQIQILLLKFNKLQQIVKSKDNQIDDLVRKIKSKNIV